MPGLAEEFEAYKAQGQLSREYDQYVAQVAHEKDLAQGGSIRTAPAERRYPIGATVGGIGLPVAAAVGSGGLSVPASAGLSALGAAGGEGIQQIIERALRLPGADLTAGEAGRRMLSEGAMQGGAGLVGAGAVKAGARALGPYGHAITPEGASAAQTLRSSLAPPLIPAQQTSARGLDVAQNIAEKSAFGGGIIKDYKATQAEMIDNLTRTFVARMGPRLEEAQLGALVEDTVKGNFQAAKAPAQAIYSAIRPLADSRGSIVSMKGAKAFAAPLQAQLERLNLPAEGQSLQGGSLLETIGNLPDRLTYSDAQKLRSTLLATRDTLTLANKKSPAIGVANQLVGYVDKAMESGLGRANPDLLQLWRTANDIYSGANTQFNNEFLRKAIRRGAEEAGNGPENTMRAVLQPGQPTRLVAVKNALGERSAEWQMVQRSGGEDLLQRATNADGVIVGERLQATMYGKPGSGSYGSDMMGVLYSPAQEARWTELANALTVTQAKQAEGTGGMLIQLVQGGALVGVATGRYFNQLDDPQALAGAGLVLLGPVSLAKLMTSESGAKWLVRAARMPKSAPEAGATIGRLLEALGRMPQSQPAHTTGRMAQSTQAFQPQQ